jgi:HAD superfamily hydrolase (TIGR01459 family)
MERLIAQGKCVGILSNSTQRAEKEITKIAAHGLIQGKHFHFFITSGEVARALFLESALPFPTPRKKFYLLGTMHPRFSTHLAIFQDTLFEETDKLDEADFIYIAVPHIDGKDQTDPLLFKESVDFLIKDLSLPIVCPNPDRFTHEGDPPTAVVRQGSIALMCEALGRKVFYIGKPSEVAYFAAMQDFKKHGIFENREILMVGDTPETDIRGARNIGMATALLIKTGIFSDRIKEEGFETSIRALTKRDYPDFFVEYMSAKR